MQRDWVHGESGESVIPTGINLDDLNKTNKVESLNKPNKHIRQLIGFKPSGRRVISVFTILASLTSPLLTVDCCVAWVSCAAMFPVSVLHCNVAFSVCNRKSRETLA